MSDKVQGTAPVDSGKLGQDGTQFKNTLNLPHTDFPMRPQPKIDDPALLKKWSEEQLYEKAGELHKGKVAYILHDGPPYANGNIHLGHAYNKILKDMVTKAYRMSGYHTHVIPGWDCHGLPIEHKVAQEQPGLSAIDTKKACRAYAQGWIDIQRAEFKRLGVVMDWDNPYVTMDFGYEAATMRAFGILVQKGYIERKNKTVAWCPSCMTTLASAEIEYQDRKDPSLYVTFPLTAESKRQLFPELQDQNVSLLVWTTTPWTLPLNKAVAVKPGAKYQLVKIGQELLIVGAQLAASLAQLVEQEYQVIREFSSDIFKNSAVQHPFIEGQIAPIIYDDFVGIDEGTACVHIAPGCGPADYELGVKNNLEIYSPVTADGKYSPEVIPQELAGMAVTDGQIWVIKKLAELGRIFQKGSIRHSYPHCWRCHNGLIFRATQQWFFDLQQIKERTLQAVETINFIPDRGRNFLRATVDNRWEWCLSRQRSWGVPIPAILCNDCHAAYITSELVEKVAQGVAKEGIEYWDMVTLKELVPADFCCSRCKGKNLRKESDILDVWFDSGISHYAVLNKKNMFPADLYLEGVDQFRGWFQSSLLTALVLEEAAPMKSIMYHGFTVDEKGRKMSKSLGNVIAPQQIIDQVGTDGLRLWVASIGHDSDAVVSETLIKNVAEVYRKIRNTCRFLLQNLYDFDMQKDGLSVDTLCYIDRIALLKLHEVNKQLQADYLKADFTAIFHGLADYCTVQLSSLYLDIIKDRLYVESAAGHKRRSAQTVVWYILDTMTRLVAPILSFTAEQLALHYQKDTKLSIHLQPFADLSSLVKGDNAQERDNQWDALLALRDVVLKAIEQQREAGVIKHSLEAAVEIVITPEWDKYAHFMKVVEQLKAQHEPIEQFLKEFFIVSLVTLKTGGTGVNKGISAQAIQAPGTKCPRCWHWEVTQQVDGLCGRCNKIVNG